MCVCECHIYLSNAYKLSSDNFIYDNLKNVLLLCCKCTKCYNVYVQNIYNGVCRRGTYIYIYIYMAFHLFHIESINSAKSLCVFVYSRVRVVRDFLWIFGKLNFASKYVLDLLGFPR